MKRYIKIFMLPVFLVLFTFNGWSQSDSTQINRKDMSEEIVDIAYGKQKKNNVASSISTISGEELVTGGITNFGNKLYGKLSGLYVLQGGGEPGNDSPQLRVRGAAGAPLIIIDGFERDLEFIAPEEIETLSVLKDASATALYGMRGADGVILITTKRGLIKKGVIEVSLQSGVQMLENRAEVLNATHYMQMYNIAAVNDGLTAKYSNDDIAAAGTSPRYPDVNWNDLLLKDFSNVSKANIGLQGGSEFIRYFVNFGFLYNNGIYKPENPDFNSNSNLTRMNVRSNIDVSITKSTTFSMDLAGSVNKSTTSAFSEDRIWNPMNFYPPNAFNAVNPDGSYGGTNLQLDNPLAIMEVGGRNSTLNHFLNAGFRLNQKLDVITEGLSLNLGYVIDNGASNSDGKWRNFQVREIKPGVGENYTYNTYRDVTGGYNLWSNANSTRYNSFSGELNYDMPEVDGNELNIIARLQRDQQYRSNADLSPYLTNNVGVRVLYARNQTYLIEVAASYFGSDQYKDGSQYGLFPSASLGWVFSNESFAEESNVLTYGKLKASYGTVGRNRFENGRYPFEQFYNGSGGYPLGTDWTNPGSIMASRLANPDVSWEISNQLNLGLELEFFNHLNLSAEYFVNKNSNILYGDDRNFSYTGATRPWENIGKSTVEGFDAKLGYASNENEFKWHADVLVSSFTHILDEFGEAKYTGDLAYLNRTGKSRSSMWGLETDGTFADNADIQSSASQTFGAPRVGDFKYVDQNNDGVINSQDRVVIGDFVANVELGLQFGMTYKNFDANLLFQGKLNNDINMMGTLQTAPFIYGNSVTEIALEDGFPPLTLSNMNNYQSSDFWVRNGDFVKLRNLEIGYTLPETMQKSLRMKHVRFFVRGVNVFTLSDYKYSDPEYTGIGYPPTKSYLLGLNINF